jgi:hypothetical protein
VTPVRIVVLGSPRTKKSHNVAVLKPSSSGKGQPCPYCRRPILQNVFPSAAWREWLKDATIEVDGFKLVETGKGKSRQVLLWTTPARPWVPISEPVNCAAVFYRARDVGDILGYEQGLADLLQDRGVIVNDALLRTWDRSRLATTDGRPRVEVELTPLQP